MRQRAVGTGGGTRCIDRNGDGPLDRVAGRDRVSCAQINWYCHALRDPGTFDPVTLGHLTSSSARVSLVDKLVIGVAINRDKDRYSVWKNGSR
jgi:hypothetical protein